VRSAARQLASELNDVYQDYVDGIEDADDWPTGTVTFSITVNSSGDVTSVSISGSGLDRDLDDKLIAVMENLTIPAPPDGGGAIQIQYSFQKIW